MLEFLRNVWGGMIGVAAAFILWFIVYFTVFMTAFGNPSPSAELILDFAEIFFMVTNPVLYLSLAYVVGAYFIHERPEHLRD